MPASEYDSELDQYFSDAEARDRVAGVVHDAVQQAVMQYGYDDELFQDWRDGKIGEKDLPEEVMAMTLDLCERWRAEQERCRRVHAAQRLSRDPGPCLSYVVAAAVAAAPTLAALPCRVVTRGEGTRIKAPSHQDRAGRGHMSLNPISSQSLPVLFIYSRLGTLRERLRCRALEALGDYPRA